LEDEVGSPVQMSGPSGGDGLWIQMALFGQESWIKEVLGPSTERAPQPVPDTVNARVATAMLYSMGQLG